MKENRSFLFWAMLCGFCINFDYSITKPTSNSIFIDAYGASFFPYAWLLLLPLNYFVVSLYNKLLPKIGCLKMFLLTTSGVILLNGSAALWLKEIPYFPFVHNVVKDIYVLLMFQQLWSVINSKINLKQAKYVYGILFGMGGLGSVMGSLVTGFWAVDLGSQNLLFMTLPIYLSFMGIYAMMLRHVHQDEIRLTKDTHNHGLKLIGASNYLIAILLIVVSMQAITTLVEYQFNSYLAELYPVQDVRTAFAGKIFSVVNSITISLQLVGSYVMLKLIGLKRSHIFVPVVLCFNAALSLFYPAFRVLTYAYATIKSFDYSLFRIITEMLYIPLKNDEKFKAKAFIDVFAYRSSKALASIFVIGLQWSVPHLLHTTISITTFAITLVWLGVVVILLNSYDLAYEGNTSPS